jgi:hypothetical protein
MLWQAWVISNQGGLVAVLVTQDLPGVGQEMYDAVNDRINAEATPPAGLIVHTSGATEGGWRIVDVWESAEQFERFSEERVRPAVIAWAEESGAEPVMPDTAVWQLHDVIKP